MVRGDEGAIKVSDGIIFPILSALSRFVKQTNELTGGEVLQAVGSRLSQGLPRRGHVDRGAPAADPVRRSADADGQVGRRVRGAHDAHRDGRALFRAGCGVLNL